MELCPGGRRPRGIFYSLARRVDAQARSALIATGTDATLRVHNPKVVGSNPVPATNDVGCNPDTWVAFHSEDSAPKRPSFAAPSTMSNAMGPSSDAWWPISFGPDELNP